MLLCAITALPAGCAESAAVSAGLSVAEFGANEFIRGELKSVHIATFQRSYDDAMEAMKMLQFEKVEGSIGEKVGTIKAYDLGGRRIRIIVTKKTETVTEFNIRVGAFGNLPMSRVILASIQARLPDPPFPIPRDLRP
jgi:hypothetical protein